MASSGRGAGDGVRRGGVSPRPRGRENAKDTLCRNVTIYGHCRYENKGCAFNHDPTKAQTQPESMKKRFNVDSPSFTPSASSSPSLSVNGLAKSAGISPKAANAAPFKPKGFSGGSDYSGLGRKAPSQYNPSAPDWSMTPSADIPDFVSQQQVMAQTMRRFHSSQRIELKLHVQDASEVSLQRIVPSVGNPVSTSFQTSTRGPSTIPPCQQSLPATSQRGGTEPSKKVQSYDHLDRPTAAVCSATEPSQAAPGHAMESNVPCEKLEVVAGNAETAPDVARSEPMSVEPTSDAFCMGSRLPSQPYKLKFVVSQSENAPPTTSGAATTNRSTASFVTPPPLLGKPEAKLWSALFPPDNETKSQSLRSLGKAGATLQLPVQQIAANAKSRALAVPSKCPWGSSVNNQMSEYKTSTQNARTVLSTGKDAGFQSTGDRTKPNDGVSLLISGSTPDVGNEHGARDIDSRIPLSNGDTAQTGSDYEGLINAKLTCPTSPFGSSSDDNFRSTKSYVDSSTTRSFYSAVIDLVAPQDEVPQRVEDSTETLLDGTCRNVATCEWAGCDISGTQNLTEVNPKGARLNLQDIVGPSTPDQLRGPQNVASSSYDGALEDNDGSNTSINTDRHQDSEHSMLYIDSKSHRTVANAMPSSGEADSRGTRIIRSPSKKTLMLSTIKVLAWNNNLVPSNVSNDMSLSNEKDCTTSEIWDSVEELQRTRKVSNIDRSQSCHHEISQDQRKVDCAPNAESASTPEARVTPPSLVTPTRKDFQLNARSEAFVPRLPELERPTPTPSTLPRTNLRQSGHRQSRSLFFESSRDPGLIPPRPAHTSSLQLSPRFPFPAPRSSHGSLFSSLKDRTLTSSLWQDPNTGLQQSMFDQYGSSPAIGNPAHGQSVGQVNPYLSDQAANGGASFFANNAFAQPLQYHLYTSQAPYREGLTPNQRLARDFFMSDTLREDLQKKSAATMQVLPHSSLPQSIAHFHSLVPLDTNNQKNATIFNYPSWVYKVHSSQNGRYYMLRRLEGFRLTNENAIHEAKQTWKRISNSNIVSIVDIFTNRSFGEANLMVATDYFPLSRTLAEVHLSNTQPNRLAIRASVPTEKTLWGYFVQIVNALKTIHAAGAAARILDPSKILLTSKNRIRLNGCAVLDVVQYDAPRPIAELQMEDLSQLGKLLLVLGTNSRASVNNPEQALEQFGRSYSTTLKHRVAHLMGIGPTNSLPRLDNILGGLEDQIMDIFDSSLQQDDTLTSELHKELENARLVRLMVKLNFITERPEFALDQQWSETGERYPIKLFRDYVFHQVDVNGNPTLDLGWVLACLNKLDAGTEEKIRLVTRDETSLLIVSYKDMKRLIETVYQELVRASRR